ncbi:MAG: transposase [Bacilli bacterium]|nr:transposase [Bacilli bacterium]
MNQNFASKTVHRAVKYRAFPSPTLILKLEAHFLACEQIFNYLLDANEAYRNQYHTDMDGRTLASLAAKEGRKYPITNRQAAYYVAPRLIYGLIRSRKEGEGTLKKKEVGGIKASFTINCSNPTFTHIRGGAKKRASLNIPLIGDIEIVNHRETPENAKFKLITVSRNPSGHYFVSLDYEIPHDSLTGPAQVKKPLGLDFSVPKLFVASDKTLSPEADMLLVRKRYANKINALHRQLSHCRKGSNNYLKIRQRLAKVYQRIDNIKNDFIHKQTHYIVNSYDFVGVETLSLKEMCERFKFYNAVHDDSWYHFVSVLKYKMEDAKKQLRFVSRYYPSSKTCHRCGYIKHDLKLSDREYVCPICHNKADRDYNAAKNIRDQALRDAGYRIHYNSTPKPNPGQNQNPPSGPAQLGVSPPIPNLEPNKDNPLPNASGDNAPTRQEGSPPSSPIVPIKRNNVL